MKLSLPPTHSWLFLFVLRTHHRINKRTNHIKERRRSFCHRSLYSLRLFMSDLSDVRMLFEVLGFFAAVLIPFAGIAKILCSVGAVFDLLALSELFLGNRVIECLLGIIRRNKRLDPIRIPLQVLRLYVSACSFEGIV